MAESKLSKLQKKSIEIKVDGVSFYLRYDLNALVSLESAYGDIEAAFDFEDNPVGAIGKLRKVLHVGLQANHEDISEEEVGAMFTMENLADFQEAIGSAMNQAMPEETAKAADGKNPPKSPKDHLPKKKKV
jgi:hypothetical protein